jgi:hypothetical protein
MSIAPRTIYGHDGTLVYDADKFKTYGLFIYRSTGDMNGYTPWDKIRVVEVQFIQKKNRWMFMQYKLKGGNLAVGRHFNSIGIPLQLATEFLQALTIVTGDATGAKNAEPTKGQPQPQQERPAPTEEDEVDKLVEKYLTRR